jgi:hypothetical protein
MLEWVYYAASADGGTDGLALFAQYGVLGVVAAILLGYARTSSKRESDRADRLEAEVTRLNDFIAGEVIKAVTTSTLAVTEAQKLMADMQQERLGYTARRRARGDFEE